MNKEYYEKTKREFEEWFNGEILFYPPLRNVAEIKLKTSKKLNQDGSTKHG